MSSHAHPTSSSAAIPAAVKGKGKAKQIEPIEEDDGKAGNTDRAGSDDDENENHREYRRLRKRHDTDVEDEEVEDEGYPRVLRTPEWDEDEEMEQLTQEAAQVEGNVKKSKKVSRRLF